MSEAVIRWIGGPVLHARVTKANSASARRSRSARSACPARSSGSRATSWSVRSTRTRPACVRATPCTGPAARCRCGLGRACSVTSSTVCCGRSTSAEQQAAQYRVSSAGQTRRHAQAGAPIGELPGADQAACLLPPDIGGTVEYDRPPKARTTARPCCARCARRRRKHEIGFFQHLAGPAGAAGRRASARRRADDHRPAHPRHAVPGRARRTGGDPRRLRHRQDRPAGDAGEMVRRRRHRLCRLRRARQRDGRGAARIPRSRRSAHRPRPDGAHGHHRQHLEHAGRRARGQHLHGGDDRRIFPRPGSERGADGRFDQPLGRGAARSVGPARRAAGRGGVSRLSRLAARRILRARGAR